MRVFVSLVLSLLVAFCHGQVYNGCDLSQEALMKMSMECLSHDPKLMLEIIEHMENPDKMANMKFVCSNQKEIVDVAMCMEKKLVGCLPKEEQPLVLALVVRERLEAALSFACQHQAELLDECLDDAATAGFAQCMSEKAQTWAASIAGPQFSTIGMEVALCRYSDFFKGCLAAHKGSCSQTYIDIYDEMFEMLLPEHHCDKSTQGLVKNGPASKLLGSLLLHGQPMLASQAGKFGPIYKMGQRN